MMARVRWVPSLRLAARIALAMGMRRLGKNAVLALREPSLGPVFGVKGGGTGGGKASLVPADDINLHFTGDIHAITTAHNLLSALVDNTTYFGDSIGDKGQIDSRQITWGRALDMNDRFLRRCIVGLGGKAHGVPREERFDITAASEVMAILALASSPEDLEQRLSRIVVALKQGAGVVTTRGHVHYVATEYGVVDLHGLGLRKRAEALISIAHPDFRGELRREVNALRHFA